MIARATCGTVSPTNTIGPAAAVAAPHSSVIATAPSTRVRAGLAPSARPASSPSPIAFSGRPSANASSRPPMTNGAICRLSDGGWPASAPTCQKRYWSSVSRSISVRPWT